MRGKRLALFGVVLTVWFLAAVARCAEPSVNVILVGWDGAQRDHVKECLARGELPTLKALADEGAMVDVDIIGTTDTKAGWSQILTGYNPEVTGVYSNGKFDTIPLGLSIFERLEAIYGKDDFVTCAIIGKKGHCGEINPPTKVPYTGPARAGDKVQGQGLQDQPGAKKGPSATIVEENGVKYACTPASPYYNMHKALEVWEFGLMQDEAVGAKALEYLDKYKGKPFFFFVHFASVDHSGHQHGENSKEYNDALISNDAWTGKIIAKLKEQGVYDKTIIVVTADHGFNEDAKGHSYAPYVTLATNSKKVIRGGLRVDVAPTIYDLFGVDTSKFEPKLDGNPLTREAPPGVAKFTPRPEVDGKKPEVGKDGLIQKLTGKKGGGGRKGKGGGMGGRRAGKAAEK
ncbi:MAG TPA: alkaline phosphatase family protein [Candidatus Brocadiia bacterium]|nr:alkaline phosphatase family protein [Candidatus Brocadiia bacterium]